MRVLTERSQFGFDSAGKAICLVQKVPEEGFYAGLGMSPRQQFARIDFG